MTEKESLIQEKLKDKEYCDVLSEVRRLLACWYGADVIPEQKRAECKRETAKKLWEIIRQVLGDPQQGT